MVLSESLVLSDAQICEYYGTSLMETASDFLVSESLQDRLQEVRLELSELRGALQAKNREYNLKKYSFVPGDVLAFQSGVYPKKFFPSEFVFGVAPPLLIIIVPEVLRDHFQVAAVTSEYEPLTPAFVLPLNTSLWEVVDRKPELVTHE